MRNAKGVSWVAQVRGQDHANEKAVMYLTDHTLNEMFDMKCDYGLRWLIVWFRDKGCDEEEAMNWWRFEEIKQVWNKHWKRMDDELISKALYWVPDEHKREAYEEAHQQIFVKDSTYYQFLEIAMTRIIAIVNKGLNKIHSTT